MKRDVEWYFSDSGATGHFLIEGATVVNKQPGKCSIKITFINGNTITSTHTCNLYIPWLLIIMTEAHLVPGLAHVSFISTRKFYNAGCQVAVNMGECQVYCKNNIFLTEGCKPVTELWRLLVNPTAVCP